MFKRQVPRLRARARLLTRATVALLLTVISGWVSTYFWTHTTFGQERFASALDRNFDHAVARLSGVGWGPSPFRWWMRGLVIAEHPEQPVLSAELAVVEIDPAAFWSDTLRFRSLTATGVGVHLAWDAEGRSNLANLRGPVDPDEPPRVPRPWAVEQVDLSGGIVSLTWPTWSLAFDSVECVGAIRRGPTEGLVIAADLTGGQASLALDERTQRFDRHVIQGFEWGQRAFRADRVAVSSALGTELMLAGEMSFTDGPSADLTGHGMVARGDTEGLLSQWLPKGGSARAVRLKRASGAPWSLGVTDALIPKGVFGSWEVVGLAASFEAEFGKGGLVPSIALQTEGATLRSLSRGASLRVDEVHVGAAKVDLGMATEANVSGVMAAGVEADGVKLHELVFEGGLVANVGGGALQASLKTRSGAVTVSGPIETSLLRRRADAQLNWRFDDVDGGLEVWLRRMLPGAELEDAPDILNGRAVGRLGVQASGPVTWSWADVEWTGGER